MRFSSNPPKKPGHVSKVWLHVWERAPVRFKRMCLLASLHAQLIKCNENDREKLEGLNNELNLVRDTRALMFPTLIAPLLWKHVIPITKINMERSDIYARRLLQRSPCWLLYADTQTIYKDLQSLLLYCRDHQPAGC